MAIRIRRIENFEGEAILVALCAAETDPMPGDLYLDDGVHYALAAKFAKDWRGRLIETVYDEHDRAAETQKLRDAKEELMKWLDQL